MKKTFAGLFALICAFALSSTKAQAEPMYRCHLTGDIHGASVAVFFGGEILSGEGTLACRNTETGVVHREPIALRLAGGGVGFEFTMVDAIHVRSTAISVANPARLYDSFGIGATTGAQLVREGIEADVAIQVSNHAGLNFDVGLQGRDAIGLGAHLYAMTFTIDRQ